MHDEEDDFDLQSEMREGYVIGDARQGGYSVSLEGKYLGHGDDFDDALVFILKHMEKNKFWPNVFYVNDHGNTDLLSLKPKMRKGAIVGATSKIIQSWV